MLLSTRRHLARKLEKLTTKAAATAAGHRCFDSSGSGSVSDLKRESFATATTTTTTTTTSTGTLIQLQRSFASSSSSDSNLVALKLDPSTGIAEVTMQNPPVNSLSLEMCEALTKSIQQAESSSKIQALILQSCSPSIFSAGLDLRELHQPKIDRLRAFWRSFQDLYLALYGSRLACIAAIEGHAPAAGCMLALSCDYRIMASSSSSDAVKKPSVPTIGLNESKLGIAAPPWLGQQMMDTVGRRQAEMALSLGVLYPPDDALKIQLVDQVVAFDQVREIARTEAARWGAIPPQARLASKLLVREERLDALRSNIDKDVEHFVAFVTDEKVQKNLSGYLEMLAKKSKQ